MFGKRQPKVPFRQRYRASKQILAHSFQLMGRERDLWLFPSLAAVLMLVWTGMIIGVLAATGTMPVVFDPSLGSPLVTVLAFLGFLVALYPAMLLGSMLQAALVYALHERMAGKPCSKRAAWSRAWGQAGALARFNLLGLLVAGLLSVVGLLLDKLRIIPYVGTAAQIVGALGWAAASYFVLPIIVVERERRSLAALKESTALARHHWGKSVTGLVTIGLAMVVPILVVLLVVSFLMIAALPLAVTAESRAALPIVLGLYIALMLVAVLAAMVLGQTAHGAYTAALYRYARTGRIAKPYTQDTLVDVWAPYRNPPGPDAP